MIISHKNKFVFLKTVKTASTSVEIAFSTFCGDQDVISPITPRDEVLRVRQGRACQNFGADKKFLETYIEQLEIGDVPAEIPEGIRKQAKYKNHMSLEKIQKLSDTSIDGYKLISIERHPYEKAISYANFILGLAKYKRGGFLKASAEDICAYIDKSLDNGGLEAKISSWKIYSLNGECRTDYMLRHENLHETFTAACEDMELSPIPEMAVTKLGIRDRSLSAKEQLTPQQRKKIQDICSKEFEHFGYKA